MSELKVYPIAETFTSPQGEGLYAGTLMHFIRLAGCTVGKPWPGQVTDSALGTKTVQGAVLPIYTEMCSLYDGRTFACDTDYRVSKKMTVHDIVATIPKGVRRICLTGGEPLMHDLRDLLNALDNYTIHFETSGTIAFREIKKWTAADKRYIAVSPKKNVLPSCIQDADEIKLLIDTNFSLNSLPKEALRHKMIFIQPVNFENTIDADNMQRCIDLQLSYPQIEFRISSQSHKLWKVR